MEPLPSVFIHHSGQDALYFQIRIDLGTNLSATLVPQGLILLDSYEEVDGYVADYGRDGSAFPVFTFSEYTEGTVNLDTEGAENIDVSIHGQNAKMFRKNDRITVYWQEGNRILMLGVSGYSEADALCFAEKVEILK